MNIDEDAIRELTLFAENCRAVYCGTTLQEPIPGPVICGPGLEWMQNCIIKHIRKGDSTKEHAEKGMYSVFTFAAKVYCRLFAGDSDPVFPPAVRRECARRYVSEHWQDWTSTAAAE